MSSKLVFLDIDGTLADERHEVPISAQEACKAARSRGHKLFICTGRSMPKIERDNARILAHFRIPALT